MQSHQPKVDICFQAMAKTIAVDHGYALFSAVSRILPHFHEDQDVGLRLIRGKYVGGGALDVSPCSELVMRIPVSHVPKYIRLAGKRLDILGESLRVGVPRTRAIISAPAVYSHLVTTKNGQEESRFDEEVSRQMGQLDVRGKLTVGKRRTFRVRKKQMVGYSVRVSDLTAEESVMLQEHGLGGRRKMGCGFFEPREDRL